MELDEFRYCFCFCFLFLPFIDDRSEEKVTHELVGAVEEEEPEEEKKKGRNGKEMMVTKSWGFNKLLFFC